jgi:CheY-like chemotaxis protein
LEGPQPQLAGLRLLIVDDNSTNCRILTLQTSKWGMIPRSTQSGPQALDWLRGGGQFDLAILDMQMPGMDGVMLAGEIRKLTGAGTMPLVLLTSMGVRTDTPDSPQAAFASCLTKPIKPAQLYESLVRVVSGAKPAARQSPGPAKLDPSLAARLPLRTMVCDDNVINQKVAVRLLQQMGYKPSLAANGAEALAALDQQAHDLIFMDIMMPEMDGLEATRLIRERQRDRAKFPNYKSPIIIVAMTASVMTGDREKCLAAGMDDYLPKPVRPEDVRLIVERWGASASPTRNADTAESAATPAASPGADRPVNEEPVVDMERLMEFTEGNAESLRELVTLYIKQTSQQIAQLETAVRANNAAEVRRIAHSCAGASATCGITRIVPPLRELERQGYEGQLTNAAELCGRIARDFERIRSFLSPYVSVPAGLAAEGRT